MIVFKLERERPAFATHAATLYYIKERHLRTYDFQSQRETTLFSLRRQATAGVSMHSKSILSCTSGSAHWRKIELSATIACHIKAAHDSAAYNNAGSCLCVWVKALLFCHFSIQLVLQALIDRHRVCFLMNTPQFNVDGVN